MLLVLLSLEFRERYMYRTKNTKVSPRRRLRVPRSSILNKIVVVRVVDILMDCGYVLILFQLMSN